MQKIKLTSKISLAAAALALFATNGAQAQNSQPFPGIIGKTSADSKEWWPQNPVAPAKSPNVIWVLLDDVGFGASSTFGGGLSIHQHLMHWQARGCVIRISTPPPSVHQHARPC